MWVRSTTELERDRSYWLDTMGGGFVLLSWDWPVANFRVQFSPDGLGWTEPAMLHGLPSTAVLADAWDPQASVSVSSIGLIGLFDTTPGDDRRAGHQVFTSPDGIEWTAQTLPDTGTTSNAAGPFAVAASDSGFAVWVTANESRPGTNMLFVRQIEGDWQEVPLPGNATTWESWIAPVGSGFLVRTEADPQALEGTHPVYRVSVEGDVSVAATPSDQPPIRWNDSLLSHNIYHVGTLPMPTLYAGPDEDTWYRLPTPDFSTDVEEQFWSIDTLTAGQPGITVAGCPCGEYWGFLGEAMVTVEVETGGHHVTIFGDIVTVEGVWDHPLSVDTAEWFDSSGRLTVPDPTTGDPIATVTCDQMRQSAKDKAWGSDLLTPPPQDLLYSPNGTAWTYLKSDDVFGDGSYVHNAATAGETIAVIVDPTGDAPTPDPPNCPLGVYPETSPLEVWISQP